MAKPVSAKLPITDGSGWAQVPQLTSGMAFSDYGSYGLRQYSGWVREEYLPSLVGRQGAVAYREMLDGSAVIGGMIFAITQAMRKVEWRVEPANDTAEAEKEAEFVESLMEDMSHTWEDFCVEALSMLGYGYAPCEIVYKRRLGPQAHRIPGPKPNGIHRASSKFDDGRIGWRRLPIRGQDTIIKWFFDPNGQVRGLTQQPWVGQLIDIPIEKLLLFRPGSHKNNPEGRSVLRNAYRSWYYTKRLEEMEAIKIERMSGFPAIYVPSELIDAAGGANADPAAVSSLAQIKKMATNVRLNEQMGIVLPSNTYRDDQGKPSAVRMYEFKFETPQHAATGNSEIDKAIQRHKTDMMLTLMCDFLMMGHEVRGTNNLAVTKVDMFHQAVEGWLNAMASVVNRYGLTRIWQMNDLNLDLMPEIVPDMSTRLDLDSLGAYVTAMSAAGIGMADEDTQVFLREAAGMPASPEVIQAAMQVMADAQQQEQDNAVELVQSKPAPAKPGANKPKPKKKQKASANAD